MSGAPKPMQALYVAGEWRDGRGRNRQPVLNPATGESFAEIPHATASDLADALEAAERGFRLWSATPGAERAAILARTAMLIRERADALAAIATREQGKPLAEAKGEALGAAMILEFHAGEAMRIYGRALPRPPGSSSTVFKQPVGPVAAFCAWNFPLINVVRKLSPAIAAGCSVILKPSEETPGSAAAIMQCFIDAGPPADVAQIVFGVPDEISRTLLASPVTRKLSFTGSGPVGKHLMKLAADTVMKVTMELGGHAPVLVFADCDLDKTLDMLVAHKFRNAGQVCISPTRFYVEAPIYARFIEGFATRAHALKIGDGEAQGTQMGPMANARRPDAIARMVDNARSLGARVVTGGERADGKGFFFQPTLIADAPLDAAAMTDEPFGPLALARSFETLDEAIAQANRLPYGLAAYCFTENARRQALLGQAIEAGMVCINNVRTSWPDAPFGGMKQSGFGSEDGPEGVEAHLVPKAVHIN